MRKKSCIVRITNCASVLHNVLHKRTSTTPFDSEFIALLSAMSLC
ncbi:hypothetical protein M5D96_003254 [Drosophila gunungcola]|uniref:Uncharacterized protein n=1 Tax=Drosophila gunungcola TaxID=103775 RepID=A0A9P9YRV5_9MUSC|nr:hypothetical protein M5D96_003254 [Drosophila gunungcola]